MPHKPYWFRNIATIERTLHAFTDPLLDRRAIAAIFQVSQTEAGRLLRATGATKVGGANVVIREVAIAWLQLKPADVQWEERRVLRLDAQLTEAARDLAARNVAVPPACANAVVDLPANIELIPGRLQIDFVGTVELLRALHELSQAAARDWPAFQRACGD